MFARLVAVMFFGIFVVGPFVGLASFAQTPQITMSETQQRSMCLTTGVGCGAGHVLLPAIGRM